MKITNLIGLFVLTIGMSTPLAAQNYPTDPTLQQITADIKKDPAAKELMVSYGYNPKDIDAGSYRFAKKDELKDYFYVSWYGRSDYAYKINLNENYMDERYFSIFLTTPKDAAGVSHKIFFKVQYNRRTPENFEDKKWNYEFLVLDPRENESYGLPKISDEQRKKIMMDYIEANIDSDDMLKYSSHIVRKIIRVDSVFAYSNSIDYYKPTGAGKFLWTLTIRGEYIYDMDNDGGIETTRQGYLSIPMEAVYKNGTYAIAFLYNTRDYNDTHAPGWQAMYDKGLGNDKKYEDHVWYSTIADVGFAKITGKTIQKEQPLGSKSFIEKRLNIIAEALKTLDSGDPEKIQKALLPMMDPSNAQELTNSYVALVKTFTEKLCTLRVYNATPKIPYSFTMGDTEGPVIEFSMEVKRESARTPELKKAYKAGGMSSAVLKSTMRGSEYGMVTNTSYSKSINVNLINNNWYITDMADLEQVKVRF